MGFGLRSAISVQESADAQLAVSSPAFPKRLFTMARICTAQLGRTHDLKFFGGSLGP